MPITALEKIMAFDKSLPRITGFENLGDFFGKNKNLLFYLCLISVVAYAADIFNFSLNIDSENHAYDYGAKTGWISQGRWGMYLLNVALLPDSIMPVIPTLIAAIGSAIGALFFVHALSPTRGIADYIAAPIAIACPVVYFAFYFTTLGYGVGIAFAVTSAGMYMLTRWTWWGALAAAACFCFGIGVYQAILPMIFSMFCLCLVSSVIEEPRLTIRKFLTRNIMFVLAMVLSYFLYEIIKRVSLAYMGITFDSSYMSGFISYQPTIEYLIGALGKTWAVAVNYYTGGAQYYLYDLVSLKTLFFLALAISTVRILFSSNQPWFIRAFAILALLAALVAPMLMHLLNNGYMPPRTVLGVPHVLAGIVFFAMGSRSKTLQSITAILAVMCIYNFCVANNKFAFSNAMVWQADRELSIQLQQKIAEALPKIAPIHDPHATYPIELVGWVEYAESPIFVQREVVGASFYKWAAGDVERVERLFRTMGVTNYRAATQTERLSVVEQAQNMPDWPYKGSVDVINGIIVIKLREYNPNQFLSMCRPPLDTDPVCIKNLPAN